MPRLLRRLRYWMRQRRVEAEVREELEFHRQSLQRDFERAGHTPREAASAAARAMGSVARAREDARAVWIWPWWQSVWQDAAYGIRILRRQPAFALVPLTALATAIGVSVSLFTVFNTVVLRPWPVKAPSRVVEVLAGGPEGARGFSLAEYRYFADRTKSFGGLTARSPVTARLGDEPVGKSARGVAVSGNFFDVLGVAMARGRAFDLLEDRLDMPHAVVVLNYRLWQARFGGDAAIVGRRISLSGVPFTVMGVASRDFVGLEPGKEDFWIPIFALPVLQPDDSSVASLLHRPDSCCVDVAGRLAADVARPQAQVEIELLSRQFRVQFALTPQRILITGTTFLERPNSKRQIVPIFALMFLGVTLVLIIACANVGNLLLARAAARAREIGVRLSLGASRGRVVRQLLTEGLVLAFGAGVIGTALAYWLPTSLLNLAGQAPPFSIVPDATVIAVGLLLTCAVCIGAGLAPALHATRHDLSTALKEQPGSFSRRLSLRGLLLAVQVAVSVCLLVGATLLARSIRQAYAHGVEYAVGDTSVISFEFPTSGYDQTRLQAFFTQLASDLGDSHISPIGLASLAPLSGSHQLAAIRFPGERVDHQRLIPLEHVSAGYFQVLRIPIVAGRTFEATDFNRQVILVNESMARRSWPGQNPIGQTVFLGSESQEVVGVVKDTHTTGLDQIEPIVYRPFRAGPRAVMLIGAEPSPANAVATFVPRIDSRVRMQVTPLADNFARSVAPARAGAILAGAVGIFALLLATIGMWGVCGYAVQQRTREIGIRIALGARPKQVISLVLADHSRALLAGFAVGLVGAAAGARLLQRYLYGISSLDPAAFGLVSTILAVAALAATYGPARQASHIDPAITLRSL